MRGTEQSLQEFRTRLNTILGRYIAGNSNDAQNSRNALIDWLLPDGIFSSWFGVMRGLQGTRSQLAILLIPVGADQGMSDRIQDNIDALIVAIANEQKALAYPSSTVIAELSAWTRWLDAFLNAPIAEGADQVNARNERLTAIHGWLGQLPDIIFHLHLDRELIQSLLYSTESGVSPNVAQTTQTMQQLHQLADDVRNNPGHSMWQQVMRALRVISNPPETKLWLRLYSLQAAIPGADNQKVSAAALAQTLTTKLAAEGVREPGLEEKIASLLLHDAAQGEVTYTFSQLLAAHKFLPELAKCTAGVATAAIRQYEASMWQVSPARNEEIRALPETAYFYQKTSSMASEFLQDLPLQPGEIARLAHTGLLETLATIPQIDQSDLMEFASIKEEVWYQAPMVGAPGEPARSQAVGAVLVPQAPKLSTLSKAQVIEFMQHIHARSVRLGLDYHAELERALQQLKWLQEAYEAQVTKVQASIDKTRQDLLSPQFRLPRDQTVQVFVKEQLERAASQLADIAAQHVSDVLVWYEQNREEPKHEELKLWEKAWKQVHHGASDDISDEYKYLQLAQASVTSTKNYLDRLKRSNDAVRLIFPQVEPTVAPNTAVGGAPAPVPAATAATTTTVTTAPMPVTTPSAPIASTAGAPAAPGATAPTAIVEWPALQRMMRSRYYNGKVFQDIDRRASIAATTATNAAGAVAAFARRHRGVTEGGGKISRLLKLGFTLPDLAYLGKQCQLKHEHIAGHRYDYVMINRHKITGEMIRLLQEARAAFRQDVVSAAPGQPKTLEQAQAENLNFLDVFNLAVDLSKQASGPKLTLEVCQKIKLYASKYKLSVNLIRGLWPYIETGRGLPIVVPSTELTQTAVMLSQLLDLPEKNSELVQNILKALYQTATDLFPRMEERWPWVQNTLLAICNQSCDKEKQKVALYWHKCFDKDVVGALHSDLVRILCDEVGLSYSDIQAIDTRLGIFGPYLGAHWIWLLNGGQSQGTAAKDMFSVKSADQITKDCRALDQRVKQASKEALELQLAGFPVDRVDVLYNHLVYPKLAASAQDVSHICYAQITQNVDVVIQPVGARAQPTTYTNKKLNDATVDIQKTLLQVRKRQAKVVQASHESAPPASAANPATALPSGVSAIAMSLGNNPLSPLSNKRTKLREEQIELSEDLEGYKKSYWHRQVLDAYHKTKLALQGLGLSTAHADSVLSEIRQQVLPPAAQPAPAQLSFTEAQAQQYVSACQEVQNNISNIRQSKLQAGILSPADLGMLEYVVSTLSRGAPNRYASVRAQLIRKWTEYGGSRGAFNRPSGDLRYFCTEKLKGFLFNALQQAEKEKNSTHSELQEVDLFKLSTLMLQYRLDYKLADLIFKIEGLDIKIFEEFCEQSYNVFGDKMGDVLQYSFADSPNPSSVYLKQMVGISRDKAVPLAQVYRAVLLNAKIVDDASRLKNLGHNIHESVNEMYNFFGIDKKDRHPDAQGKQNSYTIEALLERFAMGESLKTVQGYIKTLYAKPAANQAAEQGEASPFKTLLYGQQPLPQDSEVEQAFAKQWLYLYEFNKTRAFISKSEMETILNKAGVLPINGLLKPRFTAPTFNQNQKISIQAWGEAFVNHKVWQQLIYPTLVQHDEIAISGTPGIWSVRDLKPLLQSVPGFSLKQLDSYVMEVYQKEFPERANPATADAAYKALLEKYENLKQPALAKKRIIEQVAAIMVQKLPIRSSAQGGLNKAGKWIALGGRKTVGLFIEIPLAIEGFCRTAIGAVIEAKLAGQDISTPYDEEGALKYSYHWLSGAQSAKRHLREFGYGLSAGLLASMVVVGVVNIAQLGFYNLAAFLMEVPWLAARNALLNHMQGIMSVRTWSMIMQMVEPAATVGQLQTAVELNAIASTPSPGLPVSVVIPSIATISGLIFTGLSLYTLIERYHEYLRLQEVDETEQQYQVGLRITGCVLLTIVPLSTHLIPVGVIMQISEEMTFDSAMISNAILVFATSALAYGLIRYITQPWQDQDVENRAVIGLASSYQQFFARLQPPAPQPQEVPVPAQLNLVVPQQPEPAQPSAPLPAQPPQQPVQQALPSDGPVSPQPVPAQPPASPPGQPPQQPQQSVPSSGPVAQQPAPAQPSTPAPAQPPQQPGSRVGGANGGVGGRL